MELSTLVSVLGPVLLLVIGFLFKSKADAAKAGLALGLKLALYVLDEVAPRTATSVDDRIAAGLHMLERFLAGQNVPAAQAAQAKALFVQMVKEQK